MSDLDKDMREALRVNKFSLYFYYISLLIIILLLARFVLELRKDAKGSSTRYKGNIQIAERPCDKNDYTELNENSRSRHLSHRRRCPVRDDTSKASSSEREPPS